MAQFAWNHITFLYHQNPAKSGKGGTACEFTWRSDLSLCCIWLFDLIVWTPQNVQLIIIYRYMGGIRNENISHIPFDEEAANATVFESLLKKAASRSRIIAVCASSEVIRQLMMTASSSGLLDAGEFVFINVDRLRNCWQGIIMF